MANGQDDRDDGRVLAPDELDISEDDHVAEIDDGRYVVSPDDPINSAPATRPDTAQSSPGDAESQPVENEPSAEPVPEKSPPSEPQTEPRAEPAQSELTERRVHEWLHTEFEGNNSRYGFDVTGKFDGAVRQRQMMSNDVVTIFESLVLWYAQHIDSNTPVEEVLGILLMESNVPIRYPPESLQRMVKEAGLGPDDTIADLLEAVGDDGLKF